MRREYGSERAYQRGAHFNCVTRVSIDGVNWHHARVDDMSSGGLSLMSTVEYSVGDMLWFDLNIAGFLSEFDIKTKGEVRKKQRVHNDNHYGIKFIGLSNNDRIRIDENVLRDRIVSRGTYHND